MKRFIAAFAAAALLFTLNACSAGGESVVTQSPQQTTQAQTQSETQQAAQPAWQWQKDSPEDQGVDAAVLSAVHDTFDSFALNASVIVRNGYIIDEYYKDGYDENSVFTLHSASKSITSALFGIALDMGVIESLDTPLSQYFPQVLENEDAYWQQITLRHLLTHTSGIDMNEGADWYAWRASDNWVQYILSRRVTSRPGTQFNYLTENTHLLSAVLEQASGMSLYEFGKRCLFDPMGMRSVTLAQDAQGVSDGGNGFSMNIYDMAKFGRLFLNGGEWQGEQLVPADWVEESTTVQFERSSGSADYGYQWWVRTFGDNTYHAYFAQGHGGQYIFVVPELELVIAFTSNYEGASSIYRRLVNQIVNACR